METKKRSLAKTLSWRVVATIATVLIVYVFTQSLVISFGAGVIDTVAKTVLFYIHERGWSHVDWGLG